MLAKSNRLYPVRVFTGKEYIAREWRPVPAGLEDEARRLASDEGGNVLLLQDDKPEQEPETDGETVGETAVDESEPTLAVDLEEKTVVELKDMARDAGITIGRKSKAELIDALKDD